MKTKTLHFTRTLRLAAPVYLALSLSATAHAQTYTLTTLATFTGTANGEGLFGGVTLDSNGNLYGSAQQGGASGDGTIYKVAAGTNALTTLATFTGTSNGQYPENPRGVTLDSNGNIYGTTFEGGASGDGTVFKIAAGTNTLTTLATFNFANGENPYGSLTLDSSGNLYGTTVNGGASGRGTVFKVAAGTNTLTTLASFNNTNGQSPYAGLTLDSSGNLYGTTESGGANNDGTVFQIAAGTNSLTTIAAFNNTNGENPLAGVVFDSSGNLYGTTEYGGASGNGTVFKIAAGTSTITTLATFTGTANGANPYAGITLDSSGNLYGATYGGGASGDGTVFKIAAGTDALTTLATFTGIANGATPTGTLTIDSSGNLYGTTVQGGANNDGTVFKLSLSSGAAPEPDTLALLLPLGVPAALGLVRRRKCVPCT